MRSFDERISEINRRSEQILKERKKRRKHILMVCIPLVLCVAMIPAFFPGTTKDFAAPENTGTVSKDCEEYSITSVLRIEVSGGGFFQSYQEEGDIALIYSQLCSFEIYKNEDCEKSAEAAPDGDYKEGASAEENYGYISDSVTAGYTITLVMQDGTITEYDFAGNTLRNLTTDQEVSLSNREVQELTTALGIPQP